MAHFYVSTENTRGIGREAPREGGLLFCLQMAYRCSLNGTFLTASLGCVLPQRHFR